MSFSNSIIVPIYNEINLIENFVKKLSQSFNNLNTKFIFIDDGSTDGSGNWLKENLKNFFNKNNFKLITLNKNYGKGYAVKQGIKEIEGLYTLFIDSDLEYQPQDLYEMYDVVLKNRDIKVLYGSRNLGAKTQLRRYFLNGIAVKFNTWIYNFLFKQSLTDLHTGSKIIDNKLLKELNISADGFGLEIVMSSEIAKKNINIFEYGISYYERSFDQGKKITIIDGFKSYYFLFRERFIQNDIQTQISLLYSFIFMGYVGTYFGLGLGKILVVIFFMLVGLLIALNRKIIPLSVVFFCIYVGSLFSKGNGKIYTIILFFFIGLYLSNKLIHRFNILKNNQILKFLF